MMAPLLNAMRLQAQRQAAARRETAVGIVTSYDPANFAVRVMLQVDQILTGWLPLCSPWIGNGWGMFAAPSVGDMVEVEFVGAELDAGFVVGRFFNDEDRPVAVPSGEFWLLHKTGSFMKFTNDGDVLVTSARDLVAHVGRNLSATVVGDAGIAIDGDATLTVSGDASATIAGDLDVSAATATVNAPTTTINGQTTINGNTTVNGTLHASGAVTGGTSITATTDIADQGGTKTMAQMRTAHNAHLGHGAPGTGNAPDHLM